MKMRIVEASELNTTTLRASDYLGVPRPDEKRERAERRRVEATRQTMKLLGPALNITDPKLRLDAVRAALLQAMDADVLLPGKKCR